MNLSLALLRPPPKRSASGWANEYGRITSAEAEPGQYHVERAEYQRGVLDAFTDPAVEEIVLMSSAQVGKTLILLMVIGYFIHQDPSNLLFVFPTLTAAKDFSKEKLAPFFLQTPALAERVKESKSRDSDSTLLSKSFPGGHLAIAGANSPTSLASRNRRVVLFDEVDKYTRSSGDGGSAIKRGKARATTYRGRRKIGMVSTPGIAGESIIEDAYERGDRRKFWVPCPKCGHHQMLLWKQVRWEEGDPFVDKHGTAHRHAARAWYECESCSAEWTEADRLAAVGGGAWRAEGAFRGIASFHLWAGYSPWVTMQELATGWLEAQGKPDELQQFINETLGETWRQQGEAPEWERLAIRREQYLQGEIPHGVLMLTAGIDVQKDRFAITIKGWGRDKQNWVIEHDEILCETRDSRSYEELTRRIERRYQHPSGVSMTIRMTGIDDGYAEPQHEVREWARQHAGKVLLMKGYNNLPSMVGLPTAVDFTRAGKRVRRGVKLWQLDVSKCKHELYGWLRAPMPEPGQPFPPGHVHLPADIPDEYLKQLVAEQYVVRATKGTHKGTWEALRRNEALDCHNLCRGAYEHLGGSRLTELDYRKLEASLRVPDSPLIVAAAPEDGRRPEAAYPTPAPQIAQQQQQARLRRRGFIIASPNHG